jgi:hypothetical protein
MVEHQEARVQEIRVEGVMVVAVAVDIIITEVEGTVEVTLEANGINPQLME